MITTKLIADIGSCHMNKLEYCYEAIEVAKDCGVDIIKFQLFKEEFTKNGNIALSRTNWPAIVLYAHKVGIDIFASVFDEEAIQLLYNCEIKKIKLAYSQAFNLKLIKKAKELKMEIFASGDWENYPNYADYKLFCIPKYPVKAYQPIKYMNGFDSISSHFLGIETDKELIAKFTPTYIEKHFTLEHDDITCPDNDFALQPKELKELSNWRHNVK
jgi:sialic acid synthase SpsE